MLNCSVNNFKFNYQSFWLEMFMDYTHTCEFLAFVHVLMISFNPILDLGTFSTIFSIISKAQ